MTNQIIAAIQRFATAVKETYHIPTPVTDIRQAVESIGGILLYSNMTGVYRASPDDFAILIDKELPEKSQRFKIAIQLYYALHCMGFKTNDEKWESQVIGESFKVRDLSCALDYQTQAKLFACAFLMPISEYMNALRANRDGNQVNTTAIADHFQVHTDMVFWWGTTLQVLEPDW